MSLLWVADSFYVGVRDVNAACSWYVEKLGLKKIAVEIDEGEDCVGLVFPKELPSTIVLGPLRSPADASTRMLYASDIKRSREWLAARGVSVAAIEKDRQGTQFFAMPDLEGNVIEVSEEP